MGLRFASFLFSSKDVPGRWSCVLFLKGCNFRCKHCHNWRLVVGDEEEVSEEEVLYEISSNPFIDTLVLSGGEPTVYRAEELLEFIGKVREINPNLSVRIDTNGYRPEVVRALKDAVDGFAVDIKAPLSKPRLYSYTAGVEVDTALIEETVRLADGMPLTVYRTPRYSWLSEEEIREIEEFTASLSSPWSLNEFVEVPSCPFNTAEEGVP